MYAELTVIVNGAVEEEATFTDETLVTEFLNDLEREAEGDGVRTEVHRLDHDHAPEVDCDCAQYATDHRPYRVFDHEQDYS